jgi:hypothetical protein
MARWKQSPTMFIQDIFNLDPPRLKKGFKIGFNVRLEDIRGDWFEEFQKGKELTWQQWVVVLAVERAINGRGKRFISVSSGRGVGKSAIMAILMLWFLLCHKDAQIPCTAPSAQQMYDVLWKEVAKWHDKLPPQFKSLVDVGANYVRIKERPLSWFARAATARKERPEALSGVHSEDVMLLADEASAIPDEVFEIGVGSLTNKNALVLLISNYTRNSGYFHLSQLNKHGDFQVLSFNAEESPIVEKEAVERARRNGEDSNEYRVNVLGQPPNSAVEIKGYVPLLKRDDLRFTGMAELVQPIVLGIDPSGQGRNKTVIVARDPFKMVCLGKWDDLKPMQIMEKILEIQDKLKINPDNIFLDAFGVGTEVLNEFMRVQKFVNGVLVGNPAEDKARYVNLKAELAWRFREWVIRGGQFVGTLEEWEEVLEIRYYSELSKIKIMTKKAMLKEGFKSPDSYDAGALCFTREFYEVEREKEEDTEPFDPYQVL